MKGKDKIPGGLTDKLTIADVAKKHNTSIEKIKKELHTGINVETEHTNSKEEAEEIALDHLFELPDYYKRLEKMEKEAKKEEVSENITAYARRMRELAGLADGNQHKTLKTIQNGESSFEGGATFYAKDMARIIKEYFQGDVNGLDGVFIPNGSYTISNSGGYEIMLNDSGDSAKVRDAYGSDNPQISDWLEIEYVPSEDGELDDEGNIEMEAVIDPNGYNIPLNQVMRINENTTSKNTEDEFETHQFEQKSIEEAADDKELYKLNENTIIVLDFLDDEEDK